MQINTQNTSSLLLSDLDLHQLQRGPWHFLNHMVWECSRALSARGYGEGGVKLSGPEAAKFRELSRVADRVYRYGPLADMAQDVDRLKKQQRDGWSEQQLRQEGGDW